MQEVIMEQNENSIIVLVIIFSVCVFAMGLFFFLLINVFYKKLKNRQKEALDNLVLGQMNERERLARDLHDELVPDLSNILLTIDNFQTDSLEQIKQREKSTNELKAAIVHLRQISHNLMSVSLKKYGLAGAIQDMLDEHKNGIIVSFNSNTFGVKFSDSIKSHIFDIFLELYNNTKKHSKAKNVLINLTLVKSELILDYSDDGMGFEENNLHQNGIGLKNILTRVRMMNGDLKITGANGFNAQIKINID